METTDSGDSKWEYVEEVIFRYIRGKRVPIKTGKMVRKLKPKPLTQERMDADDAYYGKFAGQNPVSRENIADKIFQSKRRIAYGKKVEDLITNTENRQKQQYKSYYDWKQKTHKRYEERDLDNEGKFINREKQARVKNRANHFKYQQRMEDRAFKYGVGQVKREKKEKDRQKEWRRERKLREDEKNAQREIILNQLEIANMLKQESSLIDKNRIFKGIVGGAFGVVKQGINVGWNVFSSSYSAKLAGDRKNYFKRQWQAMWSPYTSMSAMRSEDEWHYQTKQDINLFGLESGNGLLQRLGGSDYMTKAQKKALVERARKRYGWSAIKTRAVMRHLHLGEQDKADQGSYLQVMSKTIGDTIKKWFKDKGMSDYYTTIVEVFGTDKDGYSKFDDIINRAGFYREGEKGDPIVKYKNNPTKDNNYLASTIDEIKEGWDRLVEWGEEKLSYFFTENGTNANFLDLMKYEIDNRIKEWFNSR